MNYTKTNKNKIILTLYPSIWMVGYVLFSGVLQHPGSAPADLPSHSYLKEQGWINQSFFCLICIEKFSLFGSNIKASLPFCNNSP